MLEAVVDWVTRQAASIHERHAVDPYVFLGLTAVCGPLFYYSLFRIVRALRANRKNLGRWSLVFLAATAIPYLYVLIFGRNLPWWVYVILAAILVQGVVQLVRKLRDGRDRVAGDSEAATR